ncbi:TonB-dependent receptor [Reichenbachiella carrageenanivorans]|uniref:TonB-dependent receptor n=1 Tax=Reichenbachiella carrageenanivorans TaxID=2979869 RepID=A0ABY6CZ08_9BACT|nr:TonB-dependent receptor [Reichenbachiella carrageenanivorans]UXX79151.1 TonB-dependent receptor [Reichenbachiella carrageenanivorans]
MTKSILTLTLILASLLTEATTIKGKVTDPSGEGLPGVNVFIQDTYDGATTDLYGYYSFDTFEKGTQTIIASFIGYKKHEEAVDLSKPITLNIELKEEVNRLSGITITAGSFEASDEKKAVVLKPLDIAMTAGALADIPGALSKLPGTSTNGESGKLFVRGGTAAETQAFIDGILVHSFYTPTPNNVPSRSRFSPFLFKGTFFSTGGYSAEYGQALSSVLSLNSNDIADETRTDFSLMTVGVDASHTQKWDNGSIYGQINYTNLDPYMSLVDQAYDWEDGYTSESGTFMLRQKLSKNDMLKVYANYDHSGFVVNQPSVNQPEDDHTDLSNNNFYLNTSYKRALGKNSTAYLGTSYGRSYSDVIYNETHVKDTQNSTHAKGYFTSDINNLSVRVGGEVMSTYHEEKASLVTDTHESDYNNHLSAGFAEADYYLTNSLTLRAGLRYSYYSIFDEDALSPRLSMALKTGENAQLSWAYGQFHQLPTGDLLLRSQQMSFERADHYMMSYQTIQNGRTFRSEIYYKKYDDLVKFATNDPYNPAKFTNTGGGYARGIDLFWRDSKTLKNVDYWISYSYIDTERDYRDYPSQANPTFAAGHNFSVVYKHFIPDIRTQIGASYSYNNGRPYEDPNKDGFNESKTSAYSDLSFNFAYLFRPHIILYSSVSNLLGRDNVFGYQYADNPDLNGVYASQPIGQPAKRFYFVGIFITLTKDKNKNNLENL